TWKTSGESHNLGFNIYREQNGNRVRMNPSLIAGSALLMSGALPKHSGKTYSWIEPFAPSLNASYWLEDVDVNGTRTMHGPVAITTLSGSREEETTASATMFSQMKQSQPAAPSGLSSHPLESAMRGFTPGAAQMQKQFELAAHSAV